MCWEVAQRPETGRKDGVSCVPPKVMLGAGCKDGVSCVPPKVMLGAGRKDGMSCSRDLEWRYDYLGASCRLMCDAQENLEGNWTQDMIILVLAFAP